jgi:hypothetical protein
MKLKEFIKELNRISHQINNPDKADVQMADYFPVARSILISTKMKASSVLPKQRNIC